MNISVEKVVLPNKPLSNIDLIEAARELKIPNFRGVFLRDTLPRKPKGNECGILNLDSSDGGGTHWVAWHKRGKNKYYFDSYGLRPRDELVSYLTRGILYNTEQVQQADQVYCGHLCLYIF